MDNGSMSRGEGAGDKTSACPFCRAENFIYRRSCWRCKQSLPTGFAMDAAAGELKATAPRPSQSDIQEALSHANVVSADMMDDTPKRSWRLKWWFRRRSEAP